MRLSPRRRRRRHRRCRVSKKIRLRQVNLFPRYKTGISQKSRKSQIWGRKESSEAEISLFFSSRRSCFTKRRKWGKKGRLGVGRWEGLKAGRKAAFDHTDQLSPGLLLSHERTDVHVRTRTERLTEKRTDGGTDGSKDKWMKNSAEKQTDYRPDFWKDDQAERPKDGQTNLPNDRSS